MSVDAARRRAEVRLADGRTGWLLAWPQGNRVGSRMPSKGSKARVVLESGAVISVPIEQVEVDPWQGQ